MTELELLAPARNADIGIAAIDCGADAVYIAGPGFGARAAAGNPIADIARLCAHAKRFGTRIFLTLNTILYDEEVEEAYSIMCGAAEAGVDAFIVQDLAVLALRERYLREHPGKKMTLHASTQCAIRTPEKARLYESLGFARLVLERELSLSQIREIRNAVRCELEFFVHGALCVCYSGQCYLSEHLGGRSGNRGECMQACRSRYDLIDSDGRKILKDKAVLSLKDYRLIERLPDLAAAGICSFKIEGRLKGKSYVQNSVSAYSQALDRLVKDNPRLYRRASYGEIRHGFEPNLPLSFNRGFTELFLDGKRGKWACMDTPGGSGEKIGRINSISKDRRGNVTLHISASPSVPLANGDGFIALDPDGTLTGFRGDVCSATSIQCGQVQGLRPGTMVYRNLSADFEKQMQARPCKRLIVANVNVRISRGANGYLLEISAITEDGRKAKVSISTEAPEALDRTRMESLISGQLGKSAEWFNFNVESISCIDCPMPLLGAASLNAVRRGLAEQLAQMPCIARPLPEGEISQAELQDRARSYKDNISNALSRERWAAIGATSIEDAYEIEHQQDAELMRTKYCIRHELGLCPKQRKGGSNSPLYIVNNGRRLRLGFDCARCEMTVSK